MRVTRIQSRRLGLEYEMPPVEGPNSRVRVLYLAPWVDYGGSDKGTIDWFRRLDRERFAPSIMTTQPSLNRRLADVIPYAEEVWPTTELFAGQDLPKVIFDFLHTRRVEVLHIMNSRIGFDLLPDLAALPRPPAVVVQLHVEEEDKSGYVRYVTTRYGNLVDAFSLSNQSLADAVERYEVPRSKCRVIYTGVDAEEEFNPERVQPIDGLEPGVVHVLFPGRLVEQKDPLLMVDVAAGVRERGLDFQVHVVGEGLLEPQVRVRVAERGLGEVVRFHPPTHEIARWFAACDVLLMTSVFEGVPYVVYEAMAMAVPIVAPALPGNAELMDDECGTLVSPRGHVGGYVEALARLIEDEDLRRRSGRHARARVRDRFSLERMGREHGELYEELIAARGKPTPEPPQRATRPEPVRLPQRPTGGSPLVSVIVPCFNHGRYLPACLDSIRAQTYSSVETIVVDDGSTDPQTVELIRELDRTASDVTVVCMPDNRGPSAARNAALGRANGRYVLPVDADNILLPDALERLVAQLQSAPPWVGFIYPNLQYFGNRNDYFEAPAYNMHSLLQGNYIDTSSLLDRELFEAGLRYPDDIVLGHEDWDFALSLAERGIYGEPATAKTLLYRKMGFTRSDVVEYGAELFHDKIVPRHPWLFERELDIKAHWSPSLSVLALGRVEGGRVLERLESLASSQNWQDFELLFPSAAPLGDGETAPAIRTLEVDETAAPVRVLEAGLRRARGSHVLVTAGDALDLLEDRALLGKLMRTLDYNVDLGAIALTDAGSAGRFPLRLLGEDDEIELDPHAVVWRVDPAAGVKASQTLGAAPERVRIREGDEIGSLTAALGGRMPLQWRHLPRPPGFARGRPGATREVQLAADGSANELAERRLRLATPPAIPELELGTVRRWTLSPTWMPPDTKLICRHASEDGTRRVITNDRKSPPGFKLEYDVGLVHTFSALGTARLVQRDDGSYAVIDRDESAPAANGLGFVEQAPLPLLDGLIHGIHRPSGDHVLIAGEEDPLTGEVEPLATLGFVESYPVNPRRRPHAELPFRVVGLVRGVDRRARRHVYAVGGVPRGDLVGELGALEREPYEDAVPLWLTEDAKLVTDDYEPVRPPLDLARAARWALAPLTWRAAVAPLAARARAAARRTLDVPVAARRPDALQVDRGRPPAGYLSREPRAGRLPLYSTVHPVTGDQLLTSWRLEADDMGYLAPQLLGYLLDLAPVTRERTFRRVSVPWASRFGHHVRRH